MRPEDLIMMTPVEQIDGYVWTKRQKIVPRSMHGVRGLANISRSCILSAEPATAYHYHHNILEIFCVNKGRRECSVFDGKSIVSCEATGNEALIIFPDEPHISGSNGIDPCDMYALQFDLADYDSFLGLSPEAGASLCRSLLELKDRRIPLNQNARTLLRCAFERFASMDEEGFTEGSAFLICFLYTLIHLPVADTAPAEGPNERIRHVLHYIAENISQPLPLTELANFAGYSLSRFKALFREVTGHTPAQYIAMRKVEQAKKLLCLPEKNITDIAYDLGWSSSNYFCSVFKKYTNISPMQYRKAHIRGAGD